MNSSIAIKHSRNLMIEKSNFLNFQIKIKRVNRIHLITDNLYLGGSSQCKS